MKKGLLLLWLILAACAPLGLGGASTATPAPTVAPTITPQPTPTRQQARPGLHATDPATVDLHDGRLKFIEFFAFW
jgi:hypothetical protein